MRGEPLEQKKTIEDFLRLLEKRSYWKITQKGEGKKFNFSEWRLRELTELSRSLKISLMHSVILFRSHFIKAMPVSQSIYHYNSKSRLRSICAIYSKSNIQIFLLLYIWFKAQHSSTYMYLFLRFKSNLHKTQVLLIFWFSVYRCHGNIDFPKIQNITNFNLRSVTGVNFTLLNG